MSLRAFFAVAWLAVGSIASPAGAADGVQLGADDIAALPAVAAGPGTSGLPAIRTVLLDGDPLQAGPYTIALFVPAHTRIATHRHRDARSVVVVAGAWHFGYGDDATAATKALGPGSFYTEPADVPHFARTGEQPATLYITGAGPTDTRYDDAGNAGP